MSSGLSYDASLENALEFLKLQPESSSLFSPANSENRSLHIVLVAPPYFDIPPAGYGGVEAVVATLADELVDHGHRVTLLGAGRPGTKARFIRVWDEVLTQRLGEPYPEIVNAMKAWQIVEALHAEDPVDVVHDHTFAGPGNAAAYRMLGIPTVVTVHGPVDPDMRDYYQSFDHSVRLVAISDRQRALAPDLNWIGRVHNAIRPEEWPFRTEKLDYALFLGRYAPYKGAHLALEAAHEAGMRLILAGKCNEPPEREFFGKSVAPLLTDTDDVFGEADATAKRHLLAGARCLLFPIRWEEPFGIVMIEAMVCGTPVIALRGGAVEEVVEHGVTGWICDDPAELPDAIARADEIDPYACRERVEKLFATDLFAQGYETAYHRAIELAAERAPRPAVLLTGVRAPTTSRALSTQVPGGRP
ncbi:glycosyltransferase family 4 protein [Nocardia aurantiaca]|uniref:Glycosyltransferase n=1 Tax=Nocardia aurantiaca TaxID=2675850 RepID=A0A6I3L5U3_9NOCA|nr:glycosyltransferase family 4 protein [Nocardia aurantiaca]MTE16871.1 glycosyltransferase [Nocardia aurantiaca]